MPKNIALLCLLFTAGLGMASASTFYITTSGQFSSADTAGPLVSPNGTYTLTFEAVSNPTPVSGTVTGLGFDIPLGVFSYTLNHTAVGVTPSEIRFNTLANGGLFDVTIGSGLSAEEFDFQGVQAFTGTTSSPTISAGSFSISSFTYSDPVNFDSQTLGGASVQISATPEPASATLILGGLAALLVLRRSSFGWARS